jgi:hypothetical protein
MSCNENYGPNTPDQNYNTLLVTKTNLVNALSAAAAVANPSYSVNGQTVDRIGYIKSLQEQISTINDLLQQERPNYTRSEFAG